MLLNTAKQVKKPQKIKEPSFTKHPEPVITSDIQKPPKLKTTTKKFATTTNLTTEHIKRRKRECGKARNEKAKNVEKCENERSGKLTDSICEGVWRHFRFEQRSGVLIIVSYEIT